MIERTQQGAIEETLQCHLLDPRLQSGVRFKNGISSKALILTPSKTGIRGPPSLNDLAEDENFRLVQTFAQDLLHKISRLSTKKRFGIQFNVGPNPLLA